MKRLLIIGGAFAVVFALIWLGGRALVAPPSTDEYDARWPLDLGRLRDVTKRFPSRVASTNANEVTRIASKLAKLDALQASVIDYLGAEVAKPDDAIAAPPAPIAKFLDDHRGAIDELRAQLIANAPPRWAIDSKELFDPPQPDVSAHFDLFAIFVTDALQQRRASNEEMAWQDLEAAWKLDRGLWDHPWSASASTALTGSRLINEAAGKLRAPAPAWWREFATFDVGRASIASVQASAWRMLEIARRFPAGSPDPTESPQEQIAQRGAEVLIGPLRIRQTNVEVQKMRESAAAFAATRDCSSRSETGIFRRARRFIAEREGVTKLLALKAASWPPAPVNIERSECTDRTWRYAQRSLSIDKPIAAEPQQRVVLPLAWRYE